MTNSRLDGAVTAVRQAVAIATGLQLECVEPDEDLICDLCLDELELESLGLIIDERFGIVIPDELWRSPLYRTPAALAEWCIRQSDFQAELELQRQRRYG